MFGLPSEKKKAAPAAAGPGLGLRGRTSRGAAIAQAQNQAPDSIPGMFKPGEFVLPPDTVHAMGGPDALKAVVDATHTPVPERAIVPPGFEPQVFFANGEGPEDQMPRGQRVAPYVNHRAPNGPPVMPEPPLLGNSVPPQTGLQATSRPNFTMGGGPEIPVRPAGPDVTDVRPKFNPANASKEAQAWMAERARTAGAGQPPPAGPAAPVSPAATVAPAPTTAPAPQGAAYRAGAAVGRVAAPALRAVGAAAVPATLAGTGGTVAATPTEDYEKRFGLQPNSLEGFAGFARDVGVRALGAASDLGDGLTMGMAGRYLFADKQGRTNEPATPPTASTGQAALPADKPSTTTASPSQPGSHEYGPPASAAPTQVIPGVYRRGTSYADSAQAAAMGDKTSAAPSAGDNAAATNLAAQYAAGGGFTPGMRGQPASSTPEIRSNPIRHSANDWQARKDLANLETGASSIMNRPSYTDAGMGRFRGGAAGGLPPAVAAYQAALQTDAALRQAQPAMDTEAMRQNGATAREDAQQAGLIRREAMQQAGESSRAGMRFGLEQQRLKSELDTRGFQQRAATQEEALRNTLIDPNASEEQRQKAQKTLRALKGEAEPSPWKVTVTPASKNADGSTTEGSIIRHNGVTGQVERVDGKSALPPGMVKQVGTAKGKPVYEDSKGQKYMGD